MPVIWSLLVACSAGVADSATDTVETSDTHETNDTVDTNDTDETWNPDFPLGELEGDCPALDEGVWSTKDPALFRNTVTLDGWDESLLSMGGAEILADGTPGGSSLESEVLAFEVLHACEGAMLVRTSGEISYVDEDGEKADFLVVIDSISVGAIVTRAVHWPQEEPYTAAEAEALLTDTLFDVLMSAANANPDNAWSRSILHVVAYDGQHADAVEDAWLLLDSAVRASTLVVLTVTDGDEIY
jgi:hypothetical protein